VNTADIMKNIPGGLITKTTHPKHGCCNEAQVFICSLPLLFGVTEYGG